MRTERVILPGLKEKYSWENCLWTLDKDTWPPSLLQKALKEIGVCFVIDMSRCTQKVNDFARQLEEESHLPTEAQFYFHKNLEKKHPFGTHWDTSDNVIVQCEGTTNFKVWEVIKGEDYGGGRGRSVEPISDPPLLDVDMSPGDAIWIPRHYPHLATSHTPRLSISFPQGYEGVFQGRDWIKL